MKTFDFKKGIGKIWSSVCSCLEEAQSRRQAFEKKCNAVLSVEPENNAQKIAQHIVKMGSVPGRGFMMSPQQLIENTNVEIVDLGLANEDERQLRQHVIAQLKKWDFEQDAEDLKGLLNMPTKRETRQEYLERILPEGIFASIE